MRLPAPRLLVVTDRSQARAPLRDILDAAFAAGCRWASLREKDLSGPEQVALARALLPIARRHGATLMLHGDPRLAREAGLDGVHLPSGADAAAARALLGPEALIGMSVHRPDEAAALGDLVDYVIAGPAYPTQSKPGYGPFLGPEGMVTLRASARMPVIAIGGIDAGNARALIDAGTAGIAVMGGVMRAGDPGTEIAGLLDAVKGS